MRHKELFVRCRFCAGASQFLQCAHQRLSACCGVRIRQPLLCLCLVRRRILLRRCHLRRTNFNEHQPIQNARRHRVDAQIAQFAVAVGILFLHSPLEHGDAAGVLVLELRREFLDFQECLVFLEGGRHGFDGLSFFDQQQLRLSVRIHRNPDYIVANRNAVKICLVGRHELRLHGQRQAQIVGVTRRSCHVLERVLDALCLALPALRAELLALLEEFLQEFVAVQGVLPVLHGDQAVAHEQVLVALIIDYLLQLIPVHFAGRRVRVLSRAGVLAAVRDVFGRLVELSEGLLTQLLIHFEEPVGVEASVVELLGRERRVACDHGLLAVIEALVHVGHEIIAAARKAVDAEHLLDELHPLRRVHGDFDQTVVGNLARLHGLFQVCCRLCNGCALHFSSRGNRCCAVRAQKASCRSRQEAPLCDRIGNFEKVRQALFLTGSADVGVVGASVQRVLAHGPQDLHQARNALHTVNAGDYL